MIRIPFIAVHVTLSVYFIISGVGSYHTAGASWDAGIPEFFCSFWFLFAAAGFLYRNVWLVTTFSVSMLFITTLYLLISAASSWTREGDPAAVLAFSPGVLAGFILFLFIGEGVAISNHLNRQKKTPGK